MKITKREILDIIHGNSELATKARLELFKDPESELFRQINDPEVPTTTELTITKEQAAIIERLNIEAIERWAGK